MARRFRVLAAERSPEPNAVRFLFSSSRRSFLAPRFSPCHIVYSERIAFNIKRATLVWFLVFSRPIIGQVRMHARWKKKSLASRRVVPNRITTFLFRILVVCRELEFDCRRPNVYLVGSANLLLLLLLLLLQPLLTVDYSARVSSIVHRQPRRPSIGAILIVAILTSYHHTTSNCK